MSAITQPALTGITAQAASDSTQVTSGASRNTPLLAPAGITGSFSTNFSKIGEGLQQAPRPDHVRPAPDLHRRPDLAVGIKHIGDGDQQDDQQQQALRDHDDQRPEIAGPELGHCLTPPPSARALPSARAEHSAMAADARAIGLVR